MLNHGSCLQIQTENFISDVFPPMFVYCMVINNFTVLFRNYKKQNKLRALQFISDTLDTQLEIWFNVFVYW